MVREQNCDDDTASDPDRLRALGARRHRAAVQARHVPRLCRCVVAAQAEIDSLKPFAPGIWWESAVTERPRGRLH